MLYIFSDVMITLPPTQLYLTHFRSACPLSLPHAQRPNPDAVPGDQTYLNQLIANGTTLKIKTEHIPLEQMPPGLAEARDAFNVMLGGVNITEATEERWNSYGVEHYEYRHTLHLYVTGPEDHARGFNPHTDPYDILIAQLSGRKQWTYCIPRPEHGHAVFGGGGSSNDAGGSGQGSTLVPGVPEAVPRATSAERSELHLQNMQRSERCTFYTTDDLTDLDWYARARVCVCVCLCMCVCVCV